MFVKFELEVLFLYFGANTSPSPFSPGLKYFYDSNILGLEDS